MIQSKARSISFRAELLGQGHGNPWVYLRFPFSVQDVFGRKGLVPVRGTLNGFAFRNSLMPRYGVHILGVSEELQHSASASPGDVVDVVLQFDDGRDESHLTRIEGGPNT